MGGLRRKRLNWAAVVLFTITIAGCGGKSKAGPPPLAGRVNISPGSNTSLVLGRTMTFSGSAQTASNTTLNVPITFSSSDTSILNLSPNGVACAGHWDLFFTTCSPGGTGVVQVTASAQGATSNPTFVFVHPAIDSVTVSGVLLDGQPVQEPCLSQGQSMTLEAHAFSQGDDITASVGPFTWSAVNFSVVTLTPLVNSAYNFPTNQVTAKATNPGITQISASATGVSSTTFQQPQYTANGSTSPVLDFFSTCPVENISLEVRAAGSGQTSFSTSKGASQTVVATVTDVMGNSTLPNTQNGIVLSKVPLTWTSSRQSILSVGAGCTDSCSVATLTPGAAAVTASCSPPSCNIGFPQIPASLSSQVQRDACTSFFHAQFPQFVSCAELIPVPVYASPVFITPPSTSTQLSPMGAISGVVSGATAPVAVLAGSTGCAHETPENCTSAVYYLTTTHGTPGNENALPVSPNSFLFTPAGDRIFMGSDFGAEAVSPGNFGTNNSPFSSLGAITGKALAVSNTGTSALFADTVHTPNQVLVANISGSAALDTALNIPAATAAAFSPDSLKAFILGNAGSSLYVYSQLQALQGPISLAAPGNAVAFSPNAAFAYVVESGNGAANLTAFATCNNQQVASVPLPATSNTGLMRVLPNLHIDGRDSLGFTIPDGVHVLVLDSTGLDIITSTISAPAGGTLCPQGLQFVSGDPSHLVQRVELGQGTLQPVNFFVSPDASQIYVANANSSTVLTYDFISGSVVGGIQLLNNATPVAADISGDAGTIVIAGSDGMVHELSTAIGGTDLQQVAFPNLPNFLNPFCTFTPSGGPCTLTTVIVKP